MTDISLTAWYKLHPCKGVGWWVECHSGCVWGMGTTILSVFTALRARRVSRQSFSPKYVRVTDMHSHDVWRVGLPIYRYRYHLAGEKLTRGKILGPYVGLDLYSSS
jgi:hypothetical protein